MMRQKETTPVVCVICGGQMKPCLASDIYHCPDCAHWSSSFSDSKRPSGSGQLVEPRRREALQPLRMRTANTILEILNKHLKLNTASLCDIGCAYGWFLEAAQARGMNALGIEPDRASANDALERGLNVRVGFFPECMEPNEKFDVIAFNDVLEHLDAVEETLMACRAHLTTSGLLAVAIPSSGGVFFRLACMLRRIGVKGPFDRLWQKAFPCPHVHYFSSQNLFKLLDRMGFDLLNAQRLPTFQIDGLWSRLRMDKNTKVAGSAAVWVSLAMLSPVLQRMPSDVMVHVYQKREGSGNTHPRETSHRVSAAARSVG